MGRHAIRRRLGAGQLAGIAVLGAIVAGAAGAGVVHMAGNRSQGFAPASSAVTATPVDPDASTADTVDGPAGGTVPRAAIVTVAGDGAEEVSTRVVAGSVTRTLSGLRPVRWFADGSLLLQDDSGAGRTVVYDPAAGRVLARVPHRYGEGIRASAGPGAAPSSFFVPGDLVVAGDMALVEVSSRLETQRTPLPKAAQRRYRPGGAVRVGDAVFVPYGKGAAAGVLRLEDGRTKPILRGEQVERLAVSSDYRHLLALVRVEVEPPNGAPDRAKPKGTDSKALRLLEVDPGTGEVGRRLRLPGAFGRRGVDVGLIDRAGDRFALQLAVACRDAEGPSCGGSGPQATWRWREGRWAKVRGTAANLILWQSKDAAVTWLRPDGPVEFLVAGRGRQVDAGAEDVVVPGGLLRPFS